MLVLTEGIERGDYMTPREHLPNTQNLPQRDGGWLPHTQSYSFHAQDTVKCFELESRQFKVGGSARRGEGVLAGQQPCGQIAASPRATLTPRQVGTSTMTRLAKERPHVSETFIRSVFLSLRKCDRVIARKLTRTAGQHHRRPP